MAQASKIRRRVREREGVARFIAETQRPGDVKLAMQALLGNVNARANGVDLTFFDVHAAREAAEALVRLEAEQVVFEDWTRVWGMGPEQVAHSIAVALSEQHPDQGATAEGDRVTFGRQRSGGWPGKLAREYAVRHRGRDPRAPMGRALARLGRRVLAAIEGQPSECLNKACHSGDVPRGRVQRVVGANGDVRYAPERWETCSHCEGTGHNLRGTLAAVEWSVAQRARASDGAHAAWNEGTGDPRIEGATTPCDPVQAMVLGHDRRRHPPSPSFVTKLTGGTPLDNHMGLTGFARLAFVERTLGAGDLTGELSRRFHTARSDTRVVPRGEHRIGPARGKDDPPWTLDQRINGRGWAPESKREAAEDMRLIFACSPAWRRGEVRAFETRRRRAWEALGVPWEGLRKLGLVTRTDRDYPDPPLWAFRGDP